MHTEPLPPGTLPLHHTLLGADGDWVLLLHGLFGSGDNLAGLGRALATRHRVVLVDLRNHGRSPHSDTMDLAVLAADVALLQDRLGIVASAVVGHSLGGKVAMQLALSAPQRVTRLVVADIAPVLYPAHHQDIFAALHAVATGALRSRGEADAQMAAFIAVPAVRQFLLKSLAHDDTGFHWRFAWRTLESAYDQLRQAPVGAAFAGPTLFIKGELSDYITPAYAQAMSAAFPHYQLETIPGSGHWLHAEQPARFNALVQAFLD